jgi:hypothetical protein
MEPQRTFGQINCNEIHDKTKEIFIFLYFPQLGLRNTCLGRAMSGHQREGRERCFILNACERAEILNALVLRSAYDANHAMPTTTSYFQLMQSSWYAG